MKERFVTCLVPLHACSKDPKLNDKICVICESKLITTKWRAVQMGLFLDCDVTTAKTKIQISLAFLCVHCTSTTENLILCDLNSVAIICEGMNKSIKKTKFQNTLDALSIAMFFDAYIQKTPRIVRFCAVGRGKCAQCGHHTLNVCKKCRIVNYCDNMCARDHLFNHLDSCDMILKHKFFRLNEFFILHYFVLKFLLLLVQQQVAMYEPYICLSESIRD